MSSTLPFPSPKVIIVSWNSRRHLPACLDSVRSRAPGADVTVVDNASTDGTRELDMLGAELVELPRNVGYARAINLAAARSPGRDLLFLNPDAELLDPVGPALELLHRPGVGGVSLELISPDGSPQPGARRRFPSLGRVVAEQAGLRFAGMSAKGPAEADWAPGAALLVSAEAWRAVGSFDEAFPFYGEDVDWFLRARRAGLRLAIAEGVRARHAERGSVAHHPVPPIAFVHRATLDLLRKHGSAASVPAAWLALLAGSLARALAGLAAANPSRARDYGVAALRLLGLRGLPPFPPDDEAAARAEVWMIDALGRGGITQYTHLLTEAMHELAARPALFTSTRFEFAAEARYPVATAFQFPRLDAATRRRLSLPARALAYRRGLRAIARDASVRRPRVVHLQGTQVPQIEAGFARRLRRAGVPVAVTLHTTFEHRSGWSRRSLAKLTERASVVFAHTGASVERAGGTGARMAGHGPYDRLPRDAGLDRAAARVALGIPREAEVVLFFGQVRPYKGLDDLVAAFAEVAARRPDALLFVQARPHEPFDRYTARLGELGLTDRSMIRLGFFPLEKVIAAVRAADVVALPYREADQSGAAVLALGQGTPVVAGRVGGIPEIVPDGEAGYLVDPGDRAGLARRIVEILQDDALRARLAHGARAASDRLPRWRDLAREALDAYPPDGGEAGR